MRKIYFITLLLLLSTFTAYGQCNILASATPGILLDYQSTVLLNCSGVAFNPILGRYYAVRAGNPAFPLETWTTAGGQLYSTTAGFDWRGMWWNPNTSQLEGNGYFNSGLWKCDLNASGYAMSTGASIFSGVQAQPDAQSCGDYDPVANEVIYYYNGAVYRYSRATNALLGSYTLAVPVGLGNINSTTVMYTGCVGKEIAILDYVSKRVYIFQKNTGVYRGTSQLPASAVTSNMFRVSWANGFIWLFDLGTGNWYSYRVFDSVLPENALSANTIWFSPSVAEVRWESNEHANYASFEVERSLDGVEFTGIGNKDAEAMDAENGTLREWSLQDATVPSIPLLYYRVKVITKAGEAHYSELMTLTRAAEAEMAMGAWPVPADHRVNVRFQNAAAGSILEVMDASGKLVHQETFSEQTAQEGIVELDAQPWAEGIYLLRMKDLQGHQATQRLVIQH